MSDCAHKNRRIRFEKSETIHTCRLCHATWTEPRMTFTGRSSGEEIDASTTPLEEDGGGLS